MAKVWVMLKVEVAEEVEVPDETVVSLRDEYTVEEDAEFRRLAREIARIARNKYENRAGGRILEAGPIYNHDGSDELWPRDDKL